MTTAPNVRMIPAKPQNVDSRNQYRQLKVATYCRVSTDSTEQLNSYQVQIDYYTEYITPKQFMTSFHWHFRDKIKYYFENSNYKAI